MEDEGYFTALVRMFDQALGDITRSNSSEKEALLQRLDAVRSITESVGWGVKDAMDELWVESRLGGLMLGADIQERTNLTPHVRIRCLAVR